MALNCSHSILWKVSKHISTRTKFEKTSSNYQNQTRLEVTHFHLTRKLTSEKFLGFVALLSKETLQKLIKIKLFSTDLPFWPCLYTPRQRLHGQSGLWSCIRIFQWYPCLVDSLFFQNVFFIINLQFQGGFVLFTVNFGFRVSEWMIQVGFEVGSWWDLQIFYKVDPHFWTRKF